MSDKSDNLATLSSVIDKAISSRLKNLHTSMPGIIESFDSVKQTASIQPAIKRIFKTTNGEVEILTPTNLPLCINVPVQFPRGGGFSLTFPVAQGDECLLMFSERSIDNWHVNGGIQKPGARRFHNLSDATAIVGLSSLPNKVPNYDPNNVELKKDDDTVSILLKNDSNIEIKAAAKTLVESPDIELKALTKVLITAPDTETTGNFKVGGNLEVIGASTLSATVTSNGKDISDTSKHVGVTPGGGVSGIVQ